MVFVHVCSRVQLLYTQLLFYGCENGYKKTKFTEELGKIQLSQGKVGEKSGKSQRI